MFYFDHEELRTLGESKHEAYVNNAPFPHIVIDNFLPEEVLSEVLGEFPEPGGIEWQNYKNAREKKLATTGDAQMGPNTRHLLSQLNSAASLDFLSALTGIEGLVPDPYYVGGGLHQITKGGFLKVHADFNWHEKLRLNRRINLLIYLNQDWQENYEGHLELWDKPMKNCVQRVLPVFNRCVIFTTTSDSWHGNPVPLACPEGMSRKSIALYYYTAEAPETGANDPHSTLFRDRPGEFAARREAFELASPREILRKLVPPIFVDAARYLTGRG